MPSGIKKPRLAKVDFAQCSCAGVNLDKFIQPAVLAALTGGPLHGYALLDAIKAMPMFEGHAPDSTGVYRLLNAMQERELVRSQWDTSSRGPAKKLFTLTEAGQACLARWLDTLDDYYQRLGKTRAALRRLAGKPRSGRCCGP